VKHLARIIEMFASAGIMVEGTVSLQSMDETTLVAIKRKNIKVEQYDNMAVEFRKNDLPLTVELMMGLPGATMDSFRDDLQECATAGPRRVNPTVLLPNSPMNDPAYRAEHGITAVAGELVKQTNSYTEQEYDRMEALRKLFLVCDRFGVLRQVAFYVRAETGMREIDFYERMLTVASADPERWPILSFTVQALEP
jgi:radical SAM superfamily enzyme